MAHLQAQYGLPLSRPRYCLDDTTRVGFAAIGQGSQEPAVSLTVDKFLVMCPIYYSQLSVLPSNYTLPQPSPHILAMLSPNFYLLFLWLNSVTSDKKTASILTSLILIIVIFSISINPLLHIN